MAGKLMKWLAVCVLGVAILTALLWTVSRLWPMPQDERRALALMRAPLPNEGRNGYALLWMLDMEGMDDASRAAALAVDAARWRADPDPAGNLAASAEARHRRVTYSSARPCSDLDRSCLADVRNDPEGVARAHAGHHGLHARIEQLGSFDHFTAPWDTHVAAMMFPIPVPHGLTDPISAHALAHVRGDTTGALQGLCGGMRAGRRLLSGADTLIGSILGAAMIERNGVVLGEVLAELPADARLPDSCLQVLQPLQATEAGMCRAMRGELAFVEMSMRYSAREPGVPLLMDVERSQARTATQLSWACDPQQRALATDLPLTAPALPGLGIDCLANAIGCFLTDVAAPIYAPYASRSQDAAAMIRLLGAQRWLRAQEDVPAAALARLPAGFRTSSRTPVISADGRWLQVARRDTSRGADHALLRVTLQPPSATSR